MSPTDGEAIPRIKDSIFDAGSAWNFIRGIACVELTGHPWEFLVFAFLMSLGRPEKVGLREICPASQTVTSAYPR